MPWKKVSSEMAEWLAGVMEPYPVEKKIMFGCPAYFVNNNMFAGLHQDSVMLRLSETDREELLSTNDEAAIFEPMQGRKMKEYVTIPESIWFNDEILEKWLRKSFNFASSLPPKEPKKKKSKKEK